MYGEPKSVTWKKERAGYYEAAFVSGKKQMKAVYNANGLLQRTFEPLSLKKMPGKVIEEARKLLPDHTPSEGRLVKSPDGKIFYDLTMKKGDELRYLTYDKNYNYMGENYFDDLVDPE